MKPEMRRPIVAGNWKMHKTAAEAVELVEGIKPLVAGLDVEVVVCPPFTCLEIVRAALADSAIGLGAQNMHWERQGAFTGEISSDMLLAAGCSYVLLGHSERRQFCGEDDSLVNRKLACALQADLCPIVCVGETLQEREAGRIEEVVLGQVGGALAGIEAGAASAVVWAYEPVWAIGTDVTATATQAEEVHAMIRHFLAGHLGQAADEVRIQYGGSVKPENAAELFAQDNIDGGLIGGAALDAGQFAAIVKAAL